MNYQKNTEKTYNILLIGHKGLLGTEIFALDSPDWKITGIDIEKIDIRSFNSCEKVLNSEKPDIVINCAAYTNVDGAETDFLQAQQVNEIGPLNLARVCEKLACKLVHFSTDYVFDGLNDSLYKENDFTNPLSVYGKTKRAGEKRIINETDNYLIIRTSWLFGINGNSFPKTMLALFEKNSVIEVVDDQRGRPTYAPNLAQAIKPLLNKEAQGIFHVANKGFTSWFGFANEIAKQTNFTNIKIVPISTDKMPRPAPRPQNSILDTSKFENLVGFSLQPWQSALSDFLKTMVFSS